MLGDIFWGDSPPSTVKYFYFKIRFFPLALLNFCCVNINNYFSFLEKVKMFDICFDILKINLFDICI